jgi:hypothetical protein
VHNRFKTCIAQRIHACTKGTNTWQDNGICRCGNTGIGRQDSISTNTFKSLLRRTQISYSVIKHRNARA